MIGQPRQHRWYRSLWYHLKTLFGYDREVHGWQWGFAHFWSARYWWTPRRKRKEVGTTRPADTHCEWCGIRFKPGEPRHFYQPPRGAEIVVCRACQQHLIEERKR